MLLCSPMLCRQLLSFTTPTTCFLKLTSCSSVIIVNVHHDDYLRSTVKPVHYQPLKKMISILYCFLSFQKLHENLFVTS